MVGMEFLNPRNAWSKPILLLIDARAASCADMFPMLMKASHRGQLFGQTTMGAGGPVVGTELNNRVVNGLSLTIGLFSPYKASGNYTDQDYVENNKTMAYHLIY
jgi:C-terminal processing protease CtpA/Prc